MDRNIEVGVADLFGLQGRRVLITGGNKGIGAALALGFARAGADVVVVSRTPDAGGTLATRVRAEGREYVEMHHDLSSRESTLALCGRLTADDAQIDALVHNAGAARYAPAAEASLTDWDETIELNLTAGFLIARTLAPGMVARRSGKLIFVGSLFSVQAGPGLVSYVASKTAVLGLVRALAAEWSPHDIQVNALLPGYVETPATAGMRLDPRERERVVARTPAGRWSTPEDLVGPAIFLASHASDFVTGGAIAVDGGWLAT